MLSSKEQLVSMLGMWRRRWFINKQRKKQTIEDLAFACVDCLRKIGFKSSKEINELIAEIKKVAKLKEDKEPLREDTDIPGSL